MKKYLFGLLAIAFAVSAVAFTTAPAVKGDAKLTNFYFQFIGTPNLQEGDVEMWEEITSIEYFNLSCAKDHFGCKLIATQVQTVEGETRPSVVYLAVGTKDPITGTHVSAVSNLQNLD